MCLCDWGERVRNREGGKVVQSSHGGKCMRFSPPLGEAGARQMYCTEYGRTKELAMR